MKETVVATSQSYLEFGVFIKGAFEATKAEGGSE
jgi:hypothetical protein